MAEHAPTPWTVVENAGEPCPTIYDAQDGIVAEPRGYMDMADGEHIVACVNTMPELVAACERTLAYLDTYAASQFVPPRGCMFDLRTALAKAKGEPNG